MSSLEQKIDKLLSGQAALMEGHMQTSDRLELKLDRLIAGQSAIGSSILKIGDVMMKLVASELEKQQKEVRRCEHS